MNRPRYAPSRDASSDFVITRPRLAVATAVFAMLVACASLVPLDEHPLRARDAWVLLVSSWPPAISSKTDFVANLILQFPFGFFFAGAVSYGRPRHQPPAFLLASVTAAALAFAIELAQGMFAARTPSMTDVVAETLGACLGAALWVRSGARLADLAGRGWREVGSLTLAPLGFYVAVWALWHWIPFDFTLRLPEVAHKYRAGLKTLLPSSAGSDVVTMIIRGTARHWLLAVPVGVVAWMLTRYGRRDHLDRAVLTGIGLVLAVHIVSLGTVSGSIEIAEIAAAGLGAAVGAMWAEQPFRARPVLGIAAIAAVLVDQWAPFRFSVHPQAVGLTPFLAYIMAAPVDATREALFKLQLGFAVAFAASLGSATGGISRLVWWGALCVAIEGGQVFLPGRYADVTDVALLFSGVLAGLATHHLFRRERGALRIDDRETAPEISVQ